MLRVKKFYNCQKYKLMWFSNQIFTHYLNKCRFILRNIWRRTNLMTKVTNPSNLLTSTAQLPLLWKIQYNLPIYTCVLESFPTLQRAKHRSKIYCTTNRKEKHRLNEALKELEHSMNVKNTKFKLLAYPKPNTLPVIFADAFYFTFGAILQKFVSTSWQPLEFSFKKLSAIG